MKCEFVRGAWRALPLPAWRAFLLERHIDRCPGCQARALGLEAVRRLGVVPENLAGEPPLRPFAGGTRRSGSAAPAPAWRYAFALFAAVAILGTAAWLSRLVPQGRLPRGTVTVLVEDAGAPAFAVLEARIGDGSARPVVFSPGKAGMTIVWFERTPL